MAEFTRDEGVIDQRNVAEADARRLAAIVESSEDAIVGLTLDGLIASWNGGAERMYGFSAAEVLARSLTILIPKERHDELLRNLERLRRGERVEPYETVRIRKDGARLDVSLAISPVRDGAGRIVGASGIGRDVTARKGAERRAAAQARVNRLLVESRDLEDVGPRLLAALADELDWAYAGLWLVEREAASLRCLVAYRRGPGDLSAFEATSRAMTFARGVGLPGRVWASGEPAWVDDVLRDANFPRAKAAAAAGLHGAACFPLRTNRGVLGVVECFSPEVRPPDPGLLLLMASIGNELGQFVERGWAEAERGELLARERAARASAEASGERLAFLVAASAELTASLDAHAVVATVARLAVPRVADQCVIDLVGDGGSLRSAAAEAALRAGRARLVDPRTIAAPLIARARPIGAMLLLMTESGRRLDAEDVPLVEELARRAAVALDNAGLYRDAQAAIRARDQFLARASHELRTPLTSALGTLRLLQRAAAASRPLPEELLDIAGRNLAAMAALVNDLLDASKLASGHDRLALEPLEVADLARSSALVVTTEAHDKGVAVHVDVPPGLGLEGDREKLERVLVNLLANAVKFTPAGGEVVLEARPDPAGLAIRVRDTGEGIAPQHVEAIFEPFFQTGPRARGRPRGTGLGLTICREIVALHGGRIWAESEGPGRGSVFAVELPTHRAGRDR